MTAKKVHATYEGVKKKVEQYRPQNLIRFYAGKDIIGYVDKKVAMQLASYSSDFRLTDSLALNDSVMDNFQTRSEALKNAYLILKRLGVAYDCDELLDIRATPLDPYIARAPRGVCRALGLLTQSVHLTAYDSEGRLLIAQRGKHKKVCPGLWDNIAAGMVMACETPDTAIFREAFEEAGLVSDDMEISEGARFTKERPVPEGWMREEVVNYEAVVKAGVKPQNNDGEVCAFATKTVDEVLDIIKKDQMMHGSAVCVLESLARQLDAPIEDDLIKFRKLRTNWQTNARIVR